MKLSQLAIREAAIRVLNLDGQQVSELRLQRKCKSCFGASLLVIKRLWNLMFAQGHLPQKGGVHHLLWALSLLKTYESEDVYSTWFHVDVATFRKWAWNFVLAISRVTLVSNPNMNTNLSVLKCNAVVIVCRLTRL